MRPSLGTHLRWAAFRALNILAGDHKTAPTPARPIARPRPSAWIFISTIGELHAIEPFLEQLQSRTQDLEWVLLTDRSIYREAYRKRFPKAEVVEIGCGLDEAHELARLRPPRLMVIAEIPLLPSDAPCRLSFAWPFEAARHGATIVAINGWAYGYAPSCRSDAIERRLLGHDWLALFDRICVQNESVALRLAEAGASASRITVTGNIKFDALDRSNWDPDQSHSPKMLAQLVASGCPLVVAGCVTDAEERDRILDAFVILRQSQPTAKLVLAPRHPENPEVMQDLCDACDRRQIRFRRRSKLADEALDKNLDSLILDTMGDLKHFYGAASVAHVGRNHNVLEPLAFGVPVTVLSHWEASYPSYPVYHGLKTAHALVEADDPAALALAWQSQMGSAAEKSGRRIRLTHSLTQAAGATQRTLDAISTLLDRKR